MVNFGEISVEREKVFHSNLELLTGLIPTVSAAFAVTLLMELQILKLFATFEAIVTILIKQFLVRTSY